MPGILIVNCGGGDRSISLTPSWSIIRAQPDQDCPDCELTQPFAGDFGYHL